MLFYLDFNFKFVGDMIGWVFIIYFVFFMRLGILKKV